MKRSCLPLLSVLPFLCVLAAFAQETQPQPEARCLDQRVEYFSAGDNISLERNAVENTGEPVPAALSVLTGFMNPVEDGEALQEKLRSNKARAKARILALLTPAQTAKMERLLANRPAFAKNLFGMEVPAPEEGGAEDDLDWVHSWKPGDPLPESVEVTPRPGAGVFPRAVGQP